jgi:hypothetical protein
MVCIEVRHAHRFLSTRLNKTDRNDARGIAEMMRVGHFKLVRVKSKASLLLCTTLIARKKLVDHTLAIEQSIGGVLKVHGLKVGSVHRCAFAAVNRIDPDRSVNPAQQSLWCLRAWHSISASDPQRESSALRQRSQPERAETPARRLRSPATSCRRLERDPTAGRGPPKTDEDSRCSKNRIDQSIRQESERRVPLRVALQGLGRQQSRRPAARVRP